MKNIFAILILLLILQNSSAQFYTKWSTSYPKPWGTHQIVCAILDSSSNYYSVIHYFELVGTSERFEIKKIDSLGQEVWNKIVWPDSIIPDTSDIDQPRIHIAPDNNILTVSGNFDFTLLKLLNEDGFEISRAYFNSIRITGAYVSNDYHYYIMALDLDSLRFLHNYILDSTMNIIYHDSSSLSGNNGVREKPYAQDIFGYIYGDFYDAGATKVFRFKNEQIVDTFRTGSNGPLVIDKFGYRYIYGNTGPTIKYDTSWNVIWTLPSCYANDLKFDSQNNFYVYNNYSDSTPVQKYDTNGNLVWSYSFNQNGMISHLTSGIVVDSLDHVIITGRKFDFLSNGTNTNDKIFVAHLSAAGHLDEYYEQYYHGSTYTWIEFPFINQNNQLTYYVTTHDSSYYECLYSHFQPNIIGEVFYDDNSNCQRDPNEAILSHVNISCSPSGLYTQSSDSGKYYFQVEDGIYHLSCDVPVNWTQTCPTSNVSITNGVANGNVNFGLRRIPGVNDLEINFTHPAVRANRDVPVLIHYQNLGSTILDGTIHFEFDSIFSFVNSLVTPDTIQMQFLSWNFSNLIPGESRQISFILHSGMYPTNTPYLNTAFIFGQFNDVNAINNLFSRSGVITGAIDPNEKHVLPKGNGINGFISPDDSILCYQIVFQNTGSDTAFYIMITDTLDENLDPLSFRVGAMSMPCNYSLSGNGVLKFVFDPCQLPDSTTDEIQSHGFINYFIKTNNNLPDGTVIKNKADIYFDYNLPVSTNTTINTIDLSLSTNEISLTSEILNIFPNPAYDIVHLQITNSGSSPNFIRIYSIDGKELKSILKYENNFSVNLEEFSNGIYFIQVSNRTGTQTKKLCIQKVKQ